MVLHLVRNIVHKVILYMQAQCKQSSKINWRSAATTQSRRCRMQGPAAHGPAMHSGGSISNPRLFIAATGVLEPPIASPTDDKTKRRSKCCNTDITSFSIHSTKSKLLPVAHRYVCHLLDIQISRGGNPKGFATPRQTWSLTPAPAQT
jgi:hypothetical protein